MRCALPILVLALVGSSPASAVWSASASGSATSGTGVMTNATRFTAACTEATSNSTVTLAWTASPDPYVSGYSILRTSSTGASVTRVVTGQATTSYTDTVTAPNGQTLTYTISATTSTQWRTAATAATGTPSYTGKQKACLTL